MAIPHASYPNGGSFNEETYNNLSDAAHKPSYSCCAFARYIYKTHNSKETGTSIAANTLVKDCPEGSILKCSYKTSTGATAYHWLIVGPHYKDATKGDGFNIYDANWVTSPRDTSPYAVRYEKMSYTAFGNKFTVSSGLKP